MLNPKPYGDKVGNKWSPFIFGFVYDVYIFPLDIYILGLACLSILMCISAKIKAIIPLQSPYIYINIYIYICIYMHVYSACNRKVVGSSPPRWELFSKKCLTVSRKASAGEYQIDKYECCMGWWYFRGLITHITWNAWLRQIQNG